MDVQTHARQVPAHVHADVAHGEAPCTHTLLTHTHTGQICAPRAHTGPCSPRCQHQPQGRACAPAWERGTRLPAINPRQKQAMGDRGSICGAV